MSKLATLWKRAICSSRCESKRESQSDLGINLSGLSGMQNPSVLGFSFL